MLSSVMLRCVFNLEPKDLLPLTRGSSSSRLLRPLFIVALPAEEIDQFLSVIQLDREYFQSWKSAWYLRHHMYNRIILSYFKRKKIYIHVYVYLDYTDVILHHKDFRSSNSNARLTINQKRIVYRAYLITRQQHVKRFTTRYDQDHLAHWNWAKEQVALSAGK